MTGYWAYLSYSHADDRQAATLHARLERFRIPAQLVGTTRGGRVVGRRLRPVFRDRDELSSAGSLGDSLQRALADSSALIVLCSPAAARSRWVAKEIEQFIELHGPARVFPLILSGTPHSGDEAECFPAPLRSGVMEPIAADFRPGRDGARDGLLKVIAGVLDVGFDSLKQRELQQRQRRLATVAAVTTAFAVGMSLLALYAFEQRSRAEQHRSQADTLITFMLGDLRTRLQAVGRLDVLEAVGDKASEYFASRPLADLDAAALSAQATALRQIGEVRIQQGRYAEAQAAFRVALAQAEELHSRHTHAPEFLFGLSQAEYWVGYSHYVARQWPEAESYFERYRRHAEALVGMAPDEPRYTVEPGFAYSNLGIVAYEAYRFDDAISAFTRCREIFEDQASRRPEDVNLAFELAATDSWLGRVHEARGQWHAALRFRQRSASEHAHIASVSNHAFHRQMAAESAAHLARVHFRRGDLPAARAHAETTRELYAALVQLDPGNADWRLRYMRHRATIAQLAYFASPDAAQLQSLLALREEMTALAAADPDNADWRERVDAVTLQTVDVALLENELNTVERLLREQNMEELAFDAGPSLEAVQLYLGYRTARLILDHKRGRISEARTAAQQMIARVESSAGVATAQSDSLALLYRVAGNAEQSSLQQLRLAQNGDRAPDRAALLSSL